MRCIRAGPRSASLACVDAAARPSNEDRRHHRPRVERRGDARGARRRGHGRRPAELLPRDARRARAERSPRACGAGSGRAPTRTDRRPAGPEDPDRRPRCSHRSSRGGRRSSSRGRTPCGADDLPVAPEVLGAVLEAGDEVLIDDGHVRLRVQRIDGVRAHCEVVTGGVGRAAQGRERSRRAAAGPVADREGPRRSRVRARARRGLRRAVVRPLAHRRCFAQVEDRGGGVARMGDREDRAQGGGRLSSSRSSTRRTR